MRAKNLNLERHCSRIDEGDANQFDVRKSFFTLILFLFNLGLLLSQETYEVGKTEYYYSQFYVTTGLPQVKRSYLNKKAFLKELGLEELPEGYHIDHKTPLYDGGSDDPSNMQLLTIEEHLKKTKCDGKRIRKKHSDFKYPTEDEYLKTYNLNNTNLYPGNTDAIYSGLDFLGRAIFRTASGRYFFFNRQGEEELLIDDDQSTE